jgi:hypothetical protein
VTHQIWIPVEPGRVPAGVPVAQTDAIGAWEVVEPGGLDARHAHSLPSGPSGDHGPATLLSP